MSLPIVEPDAAGADIGATQIFVAVPPDRDEDPVRCFETFTADLEKRRLASAFPDSNHRDGKHRRLLDSAFQILEKRKIELRLVNAHHVKNVPGKKADVEDCQWIQHLHACEPHTPALRPGVDYGEKELALVPEIRVVTRIVPSRGQGLCNPITMAASR